MLFVLFVCRCVCAASGLCLPAVPEGQTDQAGVPDPVLPGSLCSCWSGFPLRHLSDIHRWVHRRALKYVFCTRTKTTRLRMKIKQRYVFFFCPATQFKAEYHTDYSKAGQSPGSTYHLSWRICHANNTNTDLHFQLGVNGGNKYSCRAAYTTALPWESCCARAKTERIYFLEQSHDWFAYEAYFRRMKHSQSLKKAFW